MHVDALQPRILTASGANPGRAPRRDASGVSDGRRGPLHAAVREFNEARRLAGPVSWRDTAATQHRDPRRRAWFGCVIAREGAESVIRYHLANRGLAREPLRQWKPVLHTQLAQLCVVTARPPPRHTSSTGAVAAEWAQQVTGSLGLRAQLCNTSEV